MDVLCLKSVSQTFHHTNRGCDVHLIVILQKGCVYEAALAEDDEGNTLPIACWPASLRQVGMEKQLVGDC